MRNAPSVQYPVGRCVFERRLQAVFVLAWVLVQVVWITTPGWRWPPGAWWVSFLGGLAGLWFWRWRSAHVPNGVLRWDAAAQPEGLWTWESAAYRRGTPLALVEWAWDRQVVVLLRLRTAAGLSLWVWLDRQSDPQQWEALRRALKAHSGASGIFAGQARPS